MKLILATQNQGKVREMREILAPFDFELLSLSDMGLQDMEIIEDGDTFEENSLIKAKAVCEASGEAALADDSGLCVDALGGEPGVYSARFAGEHCSYEDNNAKLLGLMQGIEPERRGARFVTVITLLWPDGSRVIAKGECKGRIIESPRGEGGFGYDPVFVPDGHSKSFSEMNAEEKNALSHRGNALRKLRELLEERASL